MKTQISLLFLFIFHFHSFAQLVEDKHTIYFETDKDEISPEEKTRLENFLSNLSYPQWSTVEGIKLSGHTDSDASANYNLDLSKRRVGNVRRQLEDLSYPASKITTDFFGEDQPVDENSNALGKQHNRRVELIIIRMISPTIPPAEKKEVAEEVDCSRDTTLIFPQGTQITMSVCDYLKTKKCFSIQEFNDGDAIRNSNLTTMTSRNEPLVSAGMFDIQLCDGVCAKVRIPVRELCGRPLNFSIWGVTQNGKWIEMKNTELKIIEIGSTKYYETEVCRSGRLNFDAKSYKPPKVKIKAKGVDLVDAKISFDMPAGVYLPYKITKNKAVFRLFCPCSEPLISALAVNQMGDTLEIPYINANKRLKKRVVFGKCKQRKIVKKILFFKLREKTMYRKYFVRKSEFSEI